MPRTLDNTHLRRAKAVRDIRRALAAFAENNSRHVCYSECLHAQFSVAVPKPITLMVTLIQRKSIRTAAALLFANALSVQAYRAPENAAAAEVRQLDGALNTFALEFQRYPSQSEGLSALVTGPANIQNTNFTGYIRELPKDPWDRAYVYRFPGLHNTNGPDLYSLGEDGVSKSGGNDPDDINNWNWDQRPWSRYYARRYTQQRLLDHAYYWGIGCATIAGYIYVFWRNRFRKRCNSPTPAS